MDAQKCDFIKSPALRAGDITKTHLWPLLKSEVLNSQYERGPTRQADKKL